MSVLGFAHDEARDVELGRVCCSCHEPFTQAHGEAVACRFCHRRMSEAERAAIPVAIHEEATSAEFKRRARKKRRDRDAAGILTPEGLQVYTTKNPTETEE